MRQADRTLEILRLAGRSDNWLVNLISKPGLMLQGLTTREPDDEMIEVGIRSVEEGWELCLRPPLEGLLWVVPLKEQGRGRLTTLAVRDGRERLMETELSAARQLPRELIAHMTLFFGEE